MLDIKFIRENSDKVQKVITAKQIDLDLDHLLNLDKQRRELISESEAIRAEQKKLGPEDRDQAKELKNKYQDLDIKLKELDKEFNSLMLLVPNLYSEDTPEGKSGEDNVEKYKCGDIPSFDFKIKDHIELGKDLDIIDTETGTEVSGFRGYFLKGKGAVLHFALMQYAINKLTEKGFKMMIPPTIVREYALVGSGHFPQGADNVYKVKPATDTEDEKEPKYLAGTSESALLAYYKNKTIKDTVKLCGFTPCYRSEIGSYGKDTKGLYRVHEFMKVEQVAICEPGQAMDIYNELLSNAKEMLEELELPYRVLDICTGDMGAPKYKMCDIETWMPSRNEYGETHSNSLLTDWQARRLNIKTEDKQFAYTLNNTMVASPRLLIALLENHQQKDGSIKIPKVLHKYTGFETIQ